MTDYCPAYSPGALWFFTVNLAERRGNRLLIDKIDELRRAFEYTQRRRPFQNGGGGYLAGHLHCIWTLPADDTDFSSRWNLLKGHFSRSIEKGERISPSREKRRERGLWQRRFWEHLLRDQTDFNNPVDDIHCNPVRTYA